MKTIISGVPSAQKLPMDDQPISSRFFGESKWLSEFITPDNLEVTVLYNNLTDGMTTDREIAIACWEWVAHNVRYKPFIKGTLIIEGKRQTQFDLWCDPSLTICTRIGNCANKAFLLASLLRRNFSENRVYCVLGNLINGSGSGGHAWVQLTLDGQEYIMETTRNDIPALIEASSTKRYQCVHFFNDKEMYFVPGTTVMEPFSRGL